MLIGFETDFKYNFILILICKGLRFSESPQDSRFAILNRHAGVYENLITTILHIEFKNSLSSPRMNNNVFIRNKKQFNKFPRALPRPSEIWR